MACCCSIMEGAIFGIKGGVQCAVIGVEKAMVNLVIEIADFNAMLAAYFDAFKSCMRCGRAKSMKEQIVDDVHRVRCDHQIQ